MAAAAAAAMSLTKLLSVVESELANDLSYSSSDESTPPRVPSPEPDTDSPRPRRETARSVAHLASEKKRRANINGGFEALRSVVPSCQPCHSKAEILRRAVEHIRALSAQCAVDADAASPGATPASPSARTPSPSATPSSDTASDDKDVKRRLTFALKYIECLKRQKDELQAQVEDLKRAFAPVNASAQQLLPAMPAMRAPAGAQTTGAAAPAGPTVPGMQQPVFAGYYQMHPLMPGPVAYMPAQALYAPPAAGATFPTTSTTSAPAAAPSAKQVLATALAGRKRAAEEADVAAVASVLASNMHRPAKRAAVNA